MTKEEWLEMDEDELWTLYIKTKEPHIRDVLIEKYSPLVKYVAGKIAMNMPREVEYDDLVGWGVFGLFDAIDKFLPERDVKFKTYAVLRIQGAIYDALRADDWVPRSVRKKAKEVERAIHHLEGLHGRSCTSKEIADELQISEEEYEDMLLSISGTNILSLNEVHFSGDDNDKVSLDENLKSPVSMNPDVQIEKEEVKRVIIDAINELPENSKQVLVAYYYYDLTLKEIGKILNVTESRVSQLHTKALLKLRVKLTGIRKGLF